MKPEVQTVGARWLWAWICLGLALSGAKAGVVYLVNRDNMGGVSSSGTDTNIVQSWPIAGGGHP